MHTGYRFFPIKDSEKFLRARKSIKENDICPFCLKSFNNEDNIYFVISNQIGIPNRILHKECISTEDEAIDKLASLYEKAKVMRGKYEKWMHWFK